MTLLYFEGFEDPQLPGGFWTLGGSTNVRGGGGRTGDGYLDFHFGISDATLRFPASAKATVGFGYLLGQASNVTFLQVKTDAGATTHLTVLFDASNHLQLRLGSGSGTVIATSVQVWTFGVWNHVQVQTTIADSGGRFVLKVNGVTWLDFTGDTRNGGTSTNVDAMAFSIGPISAAMAIDDVWVCDGVDDTANTGRPDNDFLGDLSVVPLLPNGDGATSAWTPSTGTSHSGVVDEVPVNTTDYLSATTDGLRDLWTLGDLAASAFQVLAIKPTFYAQKTDTGSATIIPVLRESSGTVTADPVSIPLNTSFTTCFGTARTIKPGGGPWLPADVNALQLGVDKGS